MTFVKDVSSLDLLHPSRRSQAPPLLPHTGALLPATHVPSPFIPAPLMDDPVGSLQVLVCCFSLHICACICGGGHTHMCVLTEAGAEPLSQSPCFSEVIQEPGWPGSARDPPVSVLWL